VLRGAGLGARGFAGHDLVAELLRQRGGDGSFSGQVNLTAFGVLALDAAGAHGGNGASAAWLAGVQNPDGGWGFAAHTPSDADSTGASMQALAATGGQGAALSKAVAFLRTAQRPGGGFPLAGGAVNSQSTAWAVQGLVAARTDPGSVRRGGTPLGYLRARRAADGHYRYSAGSDTTPAWVTGQALLAVNRKQFPLAVVPRTASPTASTESATAASAPQPAPAPAAKSASHHAASGKGAGKAASASPPPAAAAPTAAPPAAPPKATSEPAGDDGPSTTLIAAGALAAACLLAAAAWLLHRRRAKRGGAWRFTRT
jgi:hypothetical protein